ncbi:chemotaxis response regulator protein-glutamate methylesterase [Temperatibacter marinus]|uniref:Protein-glutamate methylesterase/protein-glutamine glutaminase n=1 Tax=Temperatibacter marinus TaxID=1456591 RepID=A0AA52EGI7_9PROT|nr:chemotaxis response regulator protein-glutamate methylesterase [Temperatibacter marinus]WND02104.1 chemotaxis response regulator protein-glutamate methylesterase [Temperatibacter marinus]
MTETIKILICDDSALIRSILTAILSAEADMEVVGTAIHAKDAREKIKKFNPDVLTLDIEMPGMDGLSFLEKIMTLRPMPVVMISSLTQKGTASTMKAMELGVFEVVGKPTHGLKEKFDIISDDIVSKVRAAATGKVSPINRDAFLDKPEDGIKQTSTEFDLIAIGSSTGGVVAIKEIIPYLSKYSPPVVITQHMPPGYIESLAKRLNEHSKVTVKEAEDNETLQTGYVYIAPGDQHLEVIRSGAIMKTKLSDGETVSGHKPSVDVLFNSIANLSLCKAIGIILTGMGKDGAQGLLSMRERGSKTIGQDEATSVVYGMPKAASEIGAVEDVLPLQKIHTELKALCWPEQR